MDIMILAANLQQTALYLAGALGMILAIGLCLIYLRNLAEVTTLYQKARNTGGEIDTLIWDMDFNRNKIKKILEEKGIECPGDADKDPMLSLGMTPATQLYNYDLLYAAEKALTGLYETDTSLRDDEEMKRLMDKYKEIHAELVISSEKYNNRANAFNKYIRHFPASYIAERKGMTERGIFIYRKDD